MSLRIVPDTTPSKTTQAAPGAPSAPGVHDTLRSNLALTTPAPKASSTKTSQTTSTHPLEARLANWRSQQDELKATLLRRQFGIAEPVRRGMELQIVRAGEWRPAQLGGAAGVHSEILEGRDGTVDWEDVYPGGMESVVGREVDFHTEMEVRGGMQW
ncbi:hypothetical protein MBLNU230_g2246t1 [Neophaeotheca triangularis]